MQLTDQLNHILGQASKIQILRFLVMTDAELSGRRIATATGLSHVKVHTALKELNRHDVVVMRRAGKSILYRLNSNNVLVKKILIPLFEKEANLGETLKEIILKCVKQPTPKSVILFGSFASGEARPDSDIDVLIIASKKEDVPLFKEGLEKAEARITVEYGNHLAALVMDEIEFKKKFKSKNRFVRNIAKEGKVMFGRSVNDLIKPND